MIKHEQDKATCEHQWEENVYYILGRNIYTM